MDPLTKESLDLLPSDEKLFAFSVKQTLWPTIAIGLVTLLLYLPAKRFGFINFDDPSYIQNNPLVTSGLSLRNISEAFLTLHGNVSYWHPLTWISHQLDVELFGLAPGAHHVTNIIIHSANTSLVFLLAIQLFSSRCRDQDRKCLALLASSLFGLHPLRVESVAWIAERKDLLCALFYTCSMLCYLYYGTSRRPSSLHCVNILGLAALMSKPMAVTLPIILLITDYWPLKRRFCRTIVKEKIPLAIASVIVGCITLWGQLSLNAMVDLQHLSIAHRFETALVNYDHYLMSCLSPSQLCILYLRSNLFEPTQLYSAAFVLFGVTLVAIRVRKARPYLLWGWAWFLVILFPVCGVLQSGLQCRADRFTYIPAIGLTCSVCLLLYENCLGWKVRKATMLMLGSAIIIVAAARTSKYLITWRDSGSVWRQALLVDSSNYIAHINLGNYLQDQNKVLEAGSHFHEAVRLRPTALQPLLCLARYESSRGAVQRAMALYSGIVQAYPESFEAHYELGYLKVRQGQVLEGITHYEHALRSRPNTVAVLSNLAVALTSREGYQTRDLGRALLLAERAVDLSMHQHPDVLFCLSIVNFEAGRRSAAINSANDALRLAIKSGNQPLVRRISEFLNHQVGSITRGTE